MTSDAVADIASTYDWNFPVRLSSGTPFKVAVSLLSPPKEKSRVLLVRGFHASEAVRPIEGLGWSGILQCHYVYVGEGSTGWLSWPISFEGTVDRVNVQILKWPSRAPLGQNEVRRIFIEVQDVSPADESRSKMLVFAPRGELHV